MRVLIVEDDEDLANGLTTALKHEGMVVSCLSTGDGAKKSLQQFHPDMVILDLGLPDMDGIDVIKFCRNTKSELPILVLTARTDIENKVAALDQGADDYLAKPFEMDELLARLRVIGRRLSTSSTSEIKIGEVCLDTVAHTVAIGGKHLPLPKKEYMTLKILMEEAGRIKTKAMLENNLYDWGESIGSNAIEVHISNLRKKLPANFIKTIRGIGYTVSLDKSAT